MTEAEEAQVQQNQEQLSAEGQQNIEDGAELADNESLPEEHEVTEAPRQQPVPQIEQPKPVEKPGPLVISEAHENFSLDKKMEDDPTIGHPNPRHIICQFCESILIPDGQAVKVSKEINLI